MELYFLAFTLSLYWFISAPFFFSRFLCFLRSLSLFLSLPPPFFLPPSLSRLRVCSDSFSTNLLQLDVGMFLKAKVLPTTNYTVAVSYLDSIESVVKVGFKKLCLSLSLFFLYLFWSCYSFTSFITLYRAFPAWFVCFFFVFVKSQVAFLSLSALHNCAYIPQPPSDRVLERSSERRRLFAHRRRQRRGTRRGLNAVERCLSSSNDRFEYD